MRFLERREFIYDPVLFGKHDTQTALRIHREATRKCSARPTPRFMEVDRRTAKYDTLWHMPLDNRTVFSRIIDMPAINKFKRPDWRLTKVGIVPQRRDDFIIDHLLLQEFDYFPVRGDMVFWNGYRYMIINVVLEPNGYWGQTNVWLGLVCECVIPAEGDARPVVDFSQPAPSEIRQTRPLPEA